MRRFALALCLAATLPAAILPVAAQTAPMTGAEFETYANGKTLTYARDGAIWGTEQYLPGRRVIWAFTEDECKDGTWYEDGEAICFLYADEPFPQCWHFFAEANGLRAQYLGDPESTPLSEVNQSDGPMPCMGPDVGV